MAMDRRKSEELSEPVSEAAGSESSRSGSPGVTANSGGSGQGHKRERETQNGVTSSGNSGRNSFGRKSFDDRRPLEGSFAEGMACSRNPEVWGICALNYSTSAVSVKRRR